MIARILRALSVMAFIFVTVNPASAHPLGNFSINQYSALRLNRDSIALRYVVDMAEIPTFQELQESGIASIAADPNVQSYLAEKVEILRQGLSLRVNGELLPLRAESKEIVFPPGAGGLPTLKIGIIYRAKLPGKITGSDNSIVYRDANFPKRAGWKEVVAVSAPGAKILNSSVPRADRSAELSDYPTDLLNSPPQRLDARVQFALAGTAEPVVNKSSTAIDKRVDAPIASGVEAPAERKERLRPLTNSGVMNEVGGNRHLTLRDEAISVARSKIGNDAGSGDPVRLSIAGQSTPRNAFTELISTEQLGWGIVFVAFAVAAGLGAFHALEPGHGKTLVAAYLVGSRGTMKHALLLGLIVTAAHTAGVYLLGGVTLYASQYIVPERLYPWLGVVSGMMITALGMLLLIRRCRGKGVAHSHHHHGYGKQAHGHAHAHAGQWHHHDSAHREHKESRNTSTRELLALGISGGIVPCPAALVVLLSAVSMNRIGFGLLLIVAFSAGLAAVLITIGILMVGARRYMSRFQGEGPWVTQWLPMASSAFIVVVGVGLAWKACRGAGLPLLPWI